jgi:hypothetical protein
MDTLVPCRVCGNEAVIAFAELGGTAENRSLTRAWAGCSSCMRKTQDFDTVEAAVAAWNQCQVPSQLDPPVPDQPAQTQPEPDNAESGQGLPLGE